MIAYISIGNSDDKLTQVDWARFVARVDDEVSSYAKAVHGRWFSHSSAPWQNACWCLEFIDAESAQDARDALTEVRIDYRQDSAAWAVAETEFI